MPQVTYNFSNFADKIAKRLLTHQPEIATRLASAVGTDLARAYMRLQHKRIGTVFANDTINSEQFDKVDQIINELMEGMLG